MTGDRGDLDDAWATSMGGGATAGCVDVKERAVANVVWVTALLAAGVAIGAGAPAPPGGPPAAAVADPFLAPFDALAPLPTGDPSPARFPCADCHPTIAAEWASSRHARSADNAVFTAGLARERHTRCAYCHAPVGDAARGLLRGRPGASHDGVTCAACHVRGGAIWSSRPARPYGHDVSVAPSLGDERLCATCHEFSAHRVENGVLTLLPGVPMQTTVSEWRRYRDAGGAGTCQDCHLPRAADGHVTHALRNGAHDVEGLKRALTVEVAPGDRSVTVASLGVGHSFPTGDVFRRLVLRVDGVEVATFGRRFAVVDGAWRQAEDTTLQPGQPRVVPLPRGRRLTITYHYADEAEEARSVVSADELWVTLVDLPLERAPR